MRDSKVNPSGNTDTGHKAMFEKDNAVGDAIYKSECPKCGAKRKDQQLGIEETPDQFVENLVNVFREVRRVLKDDGTVWLNLGDSYCGTGHKKDSIDPLISGGKARNGQKFALNNKIEGLKSKDLVGIPWKVAFALQADGWYLRQDIIWHKPNPMPESVKDRCTKSHEYIFLLSKNAHYYFDHESIKVESSQSTEIRNKNKFNGAFKGQFKGTPNEKRWQEGRPIDEPKFSIDGKSNKRSVWTVETNSKYKDDVQEREHRQGMSKTRGEKLIVTRPKLPTQEEFVEFLKSKTNVNTLSENTDIKRSTIEHWFRLDKSGFSYPSRDDWVKISNLINDKTEKYNDINSMMTYEEYHYDDIVEEDTKNKRSVWTVTTKPYKEAHFATYPHDLIIPCIKAGCPENGTVLDPFGGSGTTAQVAAQLNRNAILCELNPEYIKIANQRLLDSLGMFLDLKITKPQTTENIK
jgi:DNA modification methylase